MRRIVFLLVLAFPAASRAREHLEYFDLLTAEAVGELGAQRYDEHAQKQFVGTLPVAGVLLGGGVGIRPVYRFPHGVRLSIEASATWGRLRAGGSAFDFSTVTRAEFLTGLGWETALGHNVVLHTATLVGLDGAWLEAHPRLALDATAAPPTPAPSLSLSRLDLRLGQQVGAHVQVTSWLALFADGTIDYDGQWRARAGIAIGRPLHDEPSLQARR